MEMLAQLRDLLPEPAEWYCFGFIVVVIAVPILIGFAYAAFRRSKRLPKIQQGFEVIRRDPPDKD